MKKQKTKLITSVLALIGSYLLFGVFGLLLTAIIIIVVVA
jgi:hypothetical protein